MISPDCDRDALARAKGLVRRVEAIEAPAQRLQELSRAYRLGADVDRDAIAIVLMGRVAFNQTAKAAPP